uniref:MRN complex-interacting protein N-terminal domain-containing protein n=1 Tax=Tetranychus urticae TaxID=32264 RepID=T1K5D3_TETUR
MVQENIVLRCVQCDMYQSQLVKQSGKWTCVICGLKQSIQRVYYHGSGAECRLQVQRLNMANES